jgi:hypothetical protein
MTQLFLAVLVLVPIFSCCAPVEASDITGIWTWNERIENKAAPVTLTLAFKDGTLSGVYSQLGIESATSDIVLKDNEVTITFKGNIAGVAVTVIFQGKIHGDRMIIGKRTTMTDPNGVRATSTRDWEAKKQKAKSDPQKMQTAANN